MHIFSYLSLHELAVCEKGKSYFSLSSKQVVSNRASTDEFHTLQCVTAGGRLRLVSGCACLMSSSVTSALTAGAGHGISRSNRY